MTHWADRGWWRCKGGFAGIGWDRVAGISVNAAAVLVPLCREEVPKKLPHVGSHS